MSKITNDGLTRAQDGLQLYPYGNSRRQSVDEFIIKNVRRLYRRPDTNPSQLIFTELAVVADDAFRTFADVRASLIVCRAVTAVLTRIASARVTYTHAVHLTGLRSVRNMEVLLEGH